MNLANPSNDIIPINVITNMANSFSFDIIGRGLSFRKKSIGNMNPMKGFTVAPVNVIAALILGIIIAST